MKEAGVTHLLVSMHELERLSNQYGIIRLNPIINERLNRFIQGRWCKPVLTDEEAGAVICELISE